MRLLCISDIHGHADALAAVLATAERRGYDKLLVAGDLCFPGAKPLETWRRLVQAGAVCVQGVGDRALATIDPATLHARSEHERARLGRLAEVRRELGELILLRLARLPPTFRLPFDDGNELVLVHGSPAAPPPSPSPTTCPTTRSPPSSATIPPTWWSAAAPTSPSIGWSPAYASSTWARWEKRRAGSAPFLHADATLIEVVGLKSRGSGSGAAPGSAGAPGSPPESIKIERLVVPLGKAA